MMLAYRRGLLKPDYKHGLQSVIREDMVLHMLGMELEASAMSEHLMFHNTMVAPHLDSKKLNIYYGHRKPQLVYASQKREYDPCRLLSGEELLVKESRDVIRAFQTMHEDGTIAAFEQQVAEQRAKLKQMQADMEL